MILLSVFAFSIVHINLLLLLLHPLPFPSPSPLLPLPLSCRPTRLFMSSALERQALKFKKHVSSQPVYARATISASVIGGGNQSSSTAAPTALAVPSIKHGKQIEWKAGKPSD